MNSIVAFIIAFLAKHFPETTLKAFRKTKSFESLNNMESYAPAPPTYTYLVAKIPEEGIAYLVSRKSKYLDNTVDWLYASSLESAANAIKSHNMSDFIIKPIQVYLLGDNQFMVKEGWLMGGPRLVLDTPLENN